jgi:hypothetical protein
MHVCARELLDSAQEAIGGTATHPGLSYLGANGVGQRVEEGQVGRLANRDAGSREEDKVAVALCLKNLLRKLAVPRDPHGGEPSI